MTSCGLSIPFINRFISPSFFSKIPPNRPRGYYQVIPFLRQFFPQNKKAGHNGCYQPVPDGKVERWREYTVIQKHRQQTGYYNHQQNCYSLPQHSASVLFTLPFPCFRFFARPGVRPFECAGCPPKNHPPPDHRTYCRTYKPHYKMQRYCKNIPRTIRM